MLPTSWKWLRHTVTNFTFSPTSLRSSEWLWKLTSIDIQQVNTSNLACLICIQSELRVYRKSIHLDDQFLDSNWMIFEDNSIFHSSYSLAPSSPRDSSFWTVWEKRMRRRLSADLDSALSENGRVWRQIERRIKTQNRNNTKTINWNLKSIKYFLKRDYISLKTSRIKQTQFQI